jgi:hypothetical protein
MIGILDTPVAKEIYQPTLRLTVSSYHIESDIYRIIEEMNKF